MDNFDFKNPSAAAVSVDLEDGVTELELNAIWGTGGVAVVLGLQAIWGTGGVALEVELHNPGQDSIELFDAVG